MSSLREKIAAMPQPQLPQKLQSPPPVAPSPPPAPPQPQLEAPPSESPALLNPEAPLYKNYLQEPPVTPADNQPPLASAPAQPKLEAPLAPAPAQPKLEAPAPSKPAVPQYKSYLQQYTQKEGLPLPVYDIVFGGALHSPMFRSTVVVNGVSYTSSKTFSTRKAAEMDVARIALLDVLQHEDNCSIDQEELTFCKAILKEYADKINAENPTYITEKGDGSGFTSLLTFNGKQYVGGEGRNKKESQHLAARAVIQSILDSDTRGVISKIIKSKKKMISPAKGKVNNPCTAQNIGKPAGIQTISNVGISASKENEPVVGNNNMVKTDTQEPCTRNSSSVSAEPASLVEDSATPNLEHLIGGSASSKKRKRKTKKAKIEAGVDAQVQVAASSQYKSTVSSDPICARDSCVSPPGSDNAVLS